MNQQGGAHTHSASGSTWKIRNHPTTSSRRVSRVETTAHRCLPAVGSPCGRQQAAWWHPCLSRRELCTAPLLPRCGKSFAPGRGDLDDGRLAPSPCTYASANTPTDSERMARGWDIALERLHATAGLHCRHTYPATACPTLIWRSISVRGRWAAHSGFTRAMHPLMCCSTAARASLSRERAVRMVSMAACNTS